MFAAKIVYLIIALFVLLPWIVFSLKKIISIYRRSRKLPVARLAVLAAGSVVIILAVLGLYSFTISYQAPLVAERAGVMFAKRVAGEMDYPTYMEQMTDVGLAAEGFTSVSGEELEQAGFQIKRYDLGISQRTYDAEKGTVIHYIRHTDGGETLYTYVKMELVDTSWKVIEHVPISGEDLNEIESNMRFYNIKP
jgi:hypothetical protein